MDPYIGAYVLAVCVGHPCVVPQVAKVYVSVYSDEEGKQRAINNLKQVAP